MHAYIDWCIFVLPETSLLIDPSVKIPIPDLYIPFSRFQVNSCAEAPGLDRSPAEVPGKEEPPSKAAGTPGSSKVFWLQCMLTVTTVERLSGNPPCPE